MPRKKSEKKTAPTASKSTAKRTKKPKVEEQTWPLNLTRDEITHVRNMLSILLPPHGEVSLSSSLLECGDSEGDVDDTLWKKVWDLCNELNIPIGEEAPDFIVGPSEPTPLAVYKIDLSEDD